MEKGSQQNQATNKLPKSRSSFLFFSPASYSSSSWSWQVFRQFHLFSIRGAQTR